MKTVIFGEIYMLKLDLYMIHTNRNRTTGNSKELRMCLSYSKALNHRHAS